MASELGQVIKKQAGEKYFDIVEDVRLNSKKYRSSNNPKYLEKYEKSDKKIDKNLNIDDLVINMQDQNKETKNKEVKDSITNKKILKRCPNGTRKNKFTGLCESLNSKNKSKKTIELIEHFEKLKNLEIQINEDKIFDKKEAKKFHKKPFKKKPYFKKKFVKKTVAI